MTDPLERRYAANLAELAVRQPDLARVLADTPVPANVRLTTGRDAFPTFRIPNDEGRSVWFGDSSMPTISAAELVGRFVGDGRNAALPGVLTGVEPLVMLGVMPTHAALFVLERRPLYIKLAFQLHDYCDAIRAGRLVFLLDDPADLRESFRTFYERHPGYELPLTLLPVAQRSAVEMVELQARVEAAGRVVTQIQAELVAAAREALLSRSRVAGSNTPRVAVLSVDPRPQALEHGRRIGRALRVVGFPHALGLPDVPEKCHILARVKAIADASAEVAVFVNGGAGAMAELLPDDLPAVSWFLPDAVMPVGGCAFRPGRPGWPVWASSHVMRESLIEAGVKPASVSVVAPAADDALASAGDDVPADCVDEPISVAMFGDLPDDRPEACGVTLPSHVRLWETLRSIATERVESCDPRFASAWLDEAQRRCGTEVREASLRERFIDGLGTLIMPAVIAGCDVAALTRGGCRIAAWGAHWPTFEHATDYRRGAVPLAEEWRIVLRATRIAVFPDASSLSIQRALDAMAAGTAVIVRNTLDRPFEEMYPGLEDTVPYFHLFTKSKALRDTARRLLASDEEQANTAAAARAIVCERHLVSHRLRTIIEATRVRRSEAAVTP